LDQKDIPWGKTSREYELTDNMGSGIKQNHKIGKKRKSRSFALSLIARQTYLPARVHLWQSHPNGERQCRSIDTWKWQSSSNKL